MIGRQVVKRTLPEWIPSLLKVLSDVVVTWLSDLVDVVEVPPGHRAKLAPGTRPILFIDRTSPPEEQLDVLLDVARVVVLGESAARLLRREIPHQRTGVATSVRHLRPVS